MSLTTITEDQTTNSGNTIAQIIASAGGDRITDPDAGAVEGIAITTVTGANGTWQYNTGSGWTDVGAVSTTSALLLRATDSLRFVPNAQNSEVGTVLFQAWDQTSGTFGTKVDASMFGGTTAFSSQAEVAVIIVNADGSYTIGLQVDDGSGGIVNTSTSLTIANVAPVLTATGNATAGGNGIYTLNLGDYDPGADTIISWTVNWGDGTIISYAGDPSSVTHTYSNDVVGLTFDITVSAIDEDGTHYSASLLAPAYIGNSVYRFDGYDGIADGSFSSSSDGITGHVNIATGSNGTYFITGFNSNNVLQYQPDGTLVGTFITAGSGGLSGAAGLAFGPDGNLYVASANNNSVLRYNGTTGAYIDTFVPSGTTGLNYPLGLVFGPDGDLYVASQGSAGIIRFDGQTGVRDSGFVVSSIGSTEDLAFGPDGNLYAAVINGGVVRIDPTSGASLGTFFRHRQRRIDQRRRHKFWP